MTKVIQVPTLNDHKNDFDKLFDIFLQNQSTGLEVSFDFSSCHFIGQSGVAFLGGIAKLIESHGGQVIFLWDTLRKKIRTNLEQNGFVCSFGGCQGPWPGHSVPYRQDIMQNHDDIIAYLKAAWLERDWVSLSKDLMNAIVGRVWEIYVNAFEHSKSKIGIFTCGQHFPKKQILKLTIIDFGVGIPANVRNYSLSKNPTIKSADISADRCIQWAFVRGNTTGAEGYSRGLGLDLLKEFVMVNKGSLEIYSDNGYALIDGGRKSEVFELRKSRFDGTLVNISLLCDGLLYQFSYETDPKPLF